MKLVKIPKRCVAAIAMYYANRACQKSEGRVGKWNKDADCERVFDSMKQQYSCSACVGTFWFSRYNKDKTKIIMLEVSESTFPKARMAEKEVGK